MYRIKGLHRGIIGKRIIFFLMMFLLHPEMNAQTTTYCKAESFLFCFKEYSDQFLADYGDNVYQLERMGQQLQTSRGRLLNGDCHLLVVSHVGAYNNKEDAVINEASLRANRIRAYIKTRFAIPHECVAFYIDRSGNYRDRVHVYLVYKPLPWFANTAIHYSESRYSNAIKAAIRQYGAVPYVDLFRRGEAGNYDREVYRIDDPLFDRSELEDYRLASVENRVCQSDRIDSLSLPLTMTVTTRETKQVVTKNEEEESNPVTSSLPVTTLRNAAGQVHFAIKSNLLPWSTVVPSVMFGVGDEKIQTGSFMPNLELEFYFRKRWSVVLSGMYASFAYRNKERDHWAVSSFCLSPKIWPLTAGEYRWLNTGLFVQYGDFDVRGEKIDTGSEDLFGRTGNFVSAGISVGSLIPLGAGFCMEGELLMGYRSVFNGEKYRYEPLDGKNYLETEFSRTGFVVDVKVNLVYRF